jgi:hypothetical protein
VGTALYAFVEKGQRQGFPPILNSVFGVLFIPQILAGEKLLEVEKQVTVTWYMVGTEWSILENFPLEVANSFFVMFTRLAFFEPTPFLQITFVCYTLLYTSTICL